MLASYSSVCVVLPLFVLYFKQAMEFPECVHAWFACEISENGHEYLHASALKCSQIRSEWSMCMRMRISMRVLERPPDMMSWVLFQSVWGLWRRKCRMGTA